MKRHSSGEKVRVLILGGGFGGMYAALELEKTLARRPDVEVTLVNRENFFLFTPMLHEVAAGDLDLTHIVSPIRSLLHRVKFFEGEVESIDLERRRVEVSHGLGQPHPHHLEYDHLVLALGSTTNFFGLPGLEERALTMKSLGDAIYLRNHLIAMLEEADPECVEDREPLLTFLVAGGGFAGVETIAALNDFLREALRSYPRLKEEQLRVVLVHPGATILPELGPELGAYAQELLGKRKVDIRVNTRVAGVSERGVELSDGTTVRTETLIWTAGTSPNLLLQDLPCKKERGRILAGETLEVPGWPGVWALGDCALVPDRRTGSFHAPTAQHALREGRVAARNIAAAVRGARKRPFTFSTLGQLAAIGKRRGVARILGHNFSGFLAWWLWRTIYLLKLPRLEKKLRVMIDWTLDLIFEKDLVKYETSRSRGIVAAGMETDAAAAGSRMESQPR